MSMVEKIPLFKFWYLNFLKRNSSSEIFENYMGNTGAIKSAIVAGRPEYLKILFKNGAMKIVAAGGVALVAEHAIHKAKVGQIYEYKVDQIMNDGKHSSEKPFSFKDNGPSILEKYIGRD